VTSAIDAEAIDRTASGALGRLARLNAWAERLTIRLEPFSISGWMSRRGPLQDGPSWSWLLVPGILGFLATTAIGIGGGLPDSPFKYELRGTWFFGEPQVAGHHYGTAMLLSTLVLVYGGLVLLLRTWIHLIRALACRPAAPLRYFVSMAIMWALPLLIVAPMFSRDIFSYAAQGEMVHNHVNPYLYGPYTSGASAYTFPVDPLWQNAPAPYGPLFLMVDGWFAAASFHHELVTVVLLRVLAVAGVVLLAYAVPQLAKVLGRDPSRAFVLGILNPLVLTSLVSGAHNDALMAGLLVYGFLLAKRRRLILALTVCALAAAVKAPAILGVGYIAWEWLGPTASVRERVRPLATGAVVTTAVFVGLSLLSGLGFGWVKNLASPGTVRSWEAPATAVGMLLATVTHALGLHVTMATTISISRLVGLAAAAAISVWLFSKVDGIGGIKATGLSLLAIVILGPVIQPWYLTWGIVLLVPVATGRLRTGIIALTTVAPFIGLPGGKTLVVNLLHVDPLATAAVLFACLVIFLCPLGRWTVPLATDTDPFVDPPIFAPVLPRLSEV